MANFRKTIATARAKVAKAEIEAFNARLEAIDAILHDASPDDVLALCAQALAAIAPICCETHQDEFKTELLRVLGDCVAIRQEQEEAEAGGDDEAHTSVHCGNVMSDMSDNPVGVLKAAVGREPIGDPPPDDGPDDDDEDDDDDC